MQSLLYLCCAKKIAPSAGLPVISDSYQVRIIPFPTLPLNYFVTPPRLAALPEDGPYTVECLRD
ncbi:MAG: hypothetical protein MUC60_17845 [Oscillatoria sp. Prado101]|nr:hypothetical protein [Oscillatoria sp. Prado101]